MHKERSTCFTLNIIEANLSEQKINPINSTLKYWKEAALKKALDEVEANRLEGLAPLSLFFFNL